MLDDAAGGVVAFGRRADRSARDLRADAGALAAAVARSGSGRWLLVTEDAYAAAVGLLALIRAGSVAVLPPNRQPETLRRLSCGARGAIVDPALGTDAFGGIATLAPLEPPPAPPVELAAAQRDATVAEFHTSGTTGEGRGIPKLLRQLEDEVRTLESVFGTAVPRGARVFASVPHQHIYGLLFRVLWPLASGRPFQSETFLHPQELLPRMAECEACALVTTPAHLKRLTANAGLEPLQGICRAVFSSGGPLDADTAKRVAAALGSAPREVLGSTETGGIAVRRQDVDGKSWTPLPGVEIASAAQGERLAVTSAFVSTGEVVAGERRRFVTGDRARLQSDGSFLLLGRADRIVKIGERRLSLPEMERDLEAHPWVAEAALLVREQASEPRVHAALVLRADGRRALREQGRGALRRMLAEHLAKSWDRVLLPRAWRSVEALPRDAQGKLPLASLDALFERPREAIALGEKRSPGRLERRLRVPADLAYLDGHFDDFPVVPGVVQLRWALEAARSLLGRPPRVRALEAVKFPQPLLPGQPLTLSVEVAAPGDRLRFRLHEGDRTFASGRCRLVSGE